MAAVDRAIIIPSIISTTGIFSSLAINVSRASYSGGTFFGIVQTQASLYDTNIGPTEWRWYDNIMASVFPILQLSRLKHLTFFFLLLQKLKTTQNQIITLSVRRQKLLVPTPPQRMMR
eukprot:469505_1